MLAFRGGSSWAGRLLKLPARLSSVSPGFGGDSLRRFDVGDRPQGRDGGKRGGNRGSGSALRRSVAFTILVLVAAVVTSVLAVGTAGAVVAGPQEAASALVGPPELAVALAGAIAQNPASVTGASLAEFP